MQLVTFQNANHDDVHLEQEEVWNVFHGWPGSFRFDKFILLNQRTDGQFDLRHCKGFPDARTFPLTKREVRKLFYWLVKSVRVEGQWLRPVFRVQVNGQEWKVQR